MKSFTACDGNSRKTWEIINEVTGRKSEKAIINELEFEDKKLTDPTEIAEGFNKFFAEIGPTLSENIEDTDTCFDKFVNESISGNFSFQQIRPSLVSSHLRKLGLLWDLKSPKVAQSRLKSPKIALSRLKSPLVSLTH